LRALNFILIATFALLLIFASSSFPARGNSDAPANQERGIAGAQNPPAYYIQHAYKDDHTPNMVSVILADYRSYDTLGEETVILTAALVCFMILRKKKKK
jgi:multicomponent Na+:H+ antiporter subunit B